MKTHEPVARPAYGSDISLPRQSAGVDEKNGILYKHTRTHKTTNSSAEVYPVCVCMRARPRVPVCAAAAGESHKCLLMASAAAVVVCSSSIAPPLGLEINTHRKRVCTVGVFFFLLLLVLFFFFIRHRCPLVAERRAHALSYAPRIRPDVNNIITIYPFGYACL